MNPAIAKYTLVASLTCLMLALGVLPFIDPERPEYVPDILAIIASTITITIVIFDVRRQVREYEVLRREEQ